MKIASRQNGTIWRIVLWGVLFGLGAGALFFFNPEAHVFYPVCWFHKLTGLNCPACGSLRAMHHLLHGEVTTAFGYNPLLVMSLPLAGVFFVRKLLQIRAGTQQNVQTNNGRIMSVLVIVLVVFGVLRNLPHSGLSWIIN